MKKDNEFLGFTLAEMLVVMLILTIVLAAFAPLMTKRKTVDLICTFDDEKENCRLNKSLALRCK